jgi:uncharacterized protein (DUF302 family)
MPRMAACPAKANRFWRLTMLANFSRLAVAVVLSMTCSAAAAAQAVATYSKAASYEDVKFELNDAIIRRGLVVDRTGQIGSMLERTGADVGSTKPLYTHAEFFTFCSAKFSRAMMEADLGNIAFCPFVVFVYEAANKPGETVVGYRKLPLASVGEASKKALADIDALLDGIAKDAVK